MLLKFVKVKICEQGVVRVENDLMHHGYKTCLLLLLFLYFQSFLVKVNGYTFRGSNSVIFIVASHINWEQRFSLKSRTHFGKTLSFK